MAIKTQTPDFCREIPDGDSHERDVCVTCGFVNYVNPKIVTGSIVRHESKIMLCRRAIEPRIGFWTLPAGFMEVGETTEQAAMREAREEANASIAIDRLLAVYTIPRIAQVQIMYLAHLEDEAFSAGQESLEVMLAGWDDIPWGATSPSPLLPGRWSNTAASKDRMTSRLSPIPKGNMPA